MLPRDERIFFLQDVGLLERCKHLPRGAGASGCGYGFASKNLESILAKCTAICFYSVSKEDQSLA
jgi:hypothetical protein